MSMTVGEELAALRVMVRALEIRTGRLEQSVLAGERDQPGGFWTDEKNLAVALVGLVETWSQNDPQFLLAWQEAARWGEEPVTEEKALAACTFLSKLLGI